MINLIVRLIDYLFYRNVTQILMYHGFCRSDEVELNTGKHVLIDEFEQQLQYLCENYTPISLSKFLASRKSRKKLPPHSVVLTFDDGFLSNYTLAFPLLEKYQVPAIIYLATEFINKKKLVWTDRVELAIRETKRSDAGLQLSKITNINELKHESDVVKLTALVNGWLKRQKTDKKNQLVKQIINVLEVNESTWCVPETMLPLDLGSIQNMQASNLIEFGAHTQTHPVLSHCSAVTLEKEIKGSKLDVEKIIKGSCIHFAYPNGGKSDFTQPVLSVVKDSGFESSVTTVMGENDQYTDPYMLNRIGVFQGLTFEQFKANLQPARRAIAGIKLRIMSLVKQ